MAKSKVAAPKSSKGAPDEARWHLGQTDKEMAFADFQHALICLSEAFYRYIGNSLSAVSGEPNLTGQDSVILHVITTMDRPKSITELQHFTNRTDISNIQYSVRKLVAAGLIEKAPKGQGRATTYRVTENGRAIVEAYVEDRRAVLEEFPDNAGTLREHIDNARQLMVMMTGLYDQASRQLTTKQAKFASRDNDE